ncbi:MAG: NRDE family protein [Pseudohongiellaceae bacterium]
MYVNNVERTTQVLAPGIHGLSNGRLNSDWPKVTQGRERLAALLSRATAPGTDDLLQMMRDPRPAADDQLPDTGVPRDLEKSLSAAFIRNPERQYGTRCSTALLVAADGAMRFSEANFDNRPSAGIFLSCPRSWPEPPQPGSKTRPVSVFRVMELPTVFNSALLWLRIDPEFFS